MYLHYLPASPRSLVPATQQFGGLVAIQSPVITAFVLAQNVLSSYLMPPG